MRIARIGLPEEFIDHALKGQRAFIARRDVSLFNSKTDQANEIIAKSLRKGSLQDVYKIREAVANNKYNNVVNCVGFAFWYCGLQAGPTDSAMYTSELGSYSEFVDVVKKPGQNKNLPTILTILNRNGKVVHMAIISPNNPSMVIQRPEVGARGEVPVQIIPLKSLLADYAKNAGKGGVVVYLQPKPERIIAHRNFANRR